VTLDLEALGVEPHREYQVHDLLGEGRFLWFGPRNYVEFDPGLPAHVFLVRRKARTERDFDYYL
jgi:starch synthase (maltosyl-transferring)